MLLTFTKIGKAIFPQATEAALDMAQKFGGDATSQAVILGKALNDPIKGISALTRIGVQFTDAQKEQIKSMVEAGDVAGAQKVILGELQTEIGGVARAAGTTLSGKLEILKNKFGNIKEEIGGALIPVITDLVTKVSDGIGPAFDWLKQNGDKLLPVLAAIGAMILAAVVPAFVIWAAAAWTTAAANIAAMAPILIPIAAIGAAVGLLVAAWQNNWFGIRDTLTAVWTNTLQPAFQNIGNWLSVNIPMAIQTVSRFWDTVLLPALQAVWRFIQTSVLPIFEDIGNWLQKNIPIAIGLAKNAWVQVLLPALQLVWDIITQKLLPVIQDVALWVGTHIGTAIETAKRLFGEFSDSAQRLWDSLEPVRSVIASIVSWISDRLRPAIDGFAGFIGGLHIANPFADLAGTIQGIIDGAARAIAKLRELAGLNPAGGGGYATGTLAFAGGYTLVGEAGPELVALPRGSRIFSNSESQRRLGAGDTLIFQFAAPASAYDEARIEAAVERALGRAGRRADTIRRTR